MLHARTCTAGRAPPGRPQIVARRPSTWTDPEVEVTSYRTIGEPFQSASGHSTRSQPCPGSASDDASTKVGAEGVPGTPNATALVSPVFPHSALLCAVTRKV